MATTAIRQWIVDGTLSPGQHLNQDEIAAALKLSRLPVREALRRLESDGLITMVPHRGAVVAQMSAEDIDDIYSVLILVEREAARIAVPNLDAETIACMQETCALMDKAKREGDRATWIDLDKKFHFALYRACRRPRLLAVVANFWDLAERYRRFWLTLPDQQQRSSDWHHKIMEACRRGDGRAVEEILVEANTGSRDILITHAREQSSLRASSVLFQQA